MINGRALGLGHPEHKITAVFVEVHQAHLKTQHFRKEGFRLVHGRQVGDDDALAILVGFLDAVSHQELGPGLGQHGDQGVVAQVVGAVDVGDADRHPGLEAEDVVRESEFDAGLMDFNKYGGDFVFRVTKAESGQPVALAKYGFVFFNYRQKTVVPMPESFRSRFG